jgi:hypothetical protein
MRVQDFDALIKHKKDFKNYGSIEHPTHLWPIGSLANHFEIRHMDF